MIITLDGKVAIVTGSASGIGRGIARGLALSGASVAIADVNIEAARRTAEALRQETQGRFLPVYVDVTRKADVEQMVETVVRELGGVDILVNSAGIAPSYPLVEFPEDAWDRTIAINLKGYFLCAQAVVKQMLKRGRGGNIINISSKTGVRGSADHSAYNATKWGEIGMTQGWARELAKYNIRVNAILPGNVLYESGIWNQSYIEARARELGIKPEEVPAYYIKQVPLKRECRVEDIANLVVFLVSDKASYLTGYSHLVDGGQEMR